nr:taxadiene 5-alpha hydroxylase [Tanacetum cinerariifolium]
MGKNSIMEKQGGSHRCLRGIITSTVNISGLEAMVPRMCNSIQKHMEKNWQNREEISLYRSTKMLTFTIVLECLFGIGIEPEKMFGVFERVLEERRRGAMENGRDEDSMLFSKLVAALIRGEITEEEVVDNVVLQVFATHDTASYAITMTFRMLANHPGCYARLLKEHEEIAVNKRSGEALTFEDVKKMEYTWQVARETMRLCPPIFGSFRSATTDIQFEGITIPIDWMVLWTTYGTHYDEKLFPDPMSFNPSRFEDPVQAYSFIPFGGGPRLCAGYQLAKLNILLKIEARSAMKYYTTKRIYSFANAEDKLWWKDLDGKLSSFAVSHLWQAIRPRSNSIDWFDVVWFSQSIPRNAFLIWLLMTYSMDRPDPHTILGLIANTGHGLGLRPSGVTGSGNRDHPHGRSHPHRLDASNEGHHEDREHFCGVGESYDDSHSHSYHDRDRSRHMKRRKDSESSLSSVSKSDSSDERYRKSKSKRHKPTDEDDLTRPWMCEEGAPECMRIFGFMHGVNNPELTKRLNEHVSKTMEEMMITTTAFIRGEVVVATKKKGHTSWRTQDQSKRKTSEKMSDFRGHSKEGSGSSRFTPLIRTPKEILMAEAGKFQPPPPMVTPVEKRSSNKFCDFHNDKGHSTNECMQIKKQIKELMQAGKLSHLIKEIKHGRDQSKVGKKETPAKYKPAEIYVIQSWQRMTRKKVTQSFERVREITFPPLTTSSGAEGPLVIEAEIGGHMIHRMYVDGGSSMKILYEHCFNRL